MNTLTINLTDDRLRALDKLSTRLRMTSEELVRLSIEDILTRPEETFQHAMEYVLDKNSELYQRLAA
ncbi:MAG: DNA-binding protein [Chloroflexota bacterium]|nr:DNA-binding protein [Chloroflexota bacterium]